METPPADVFKDLEGTTVITGKADFYSEFTSTITTTKDQFRMYGMAFATYYVTIDEYMGLTGEYDSVLTAVQGLYDNGATFYTVNSRKKFSVATISRPDENTDVSSYGTKYYVEYTYYGNTVDRLDIE